MLDEWNAIYIKSNGEIVKLTWNEVYILGCLIDHKNRLSTRKELTEAVYGAGSYWEKNKAIGVFIDRIKKKLKGELDITNYHGVGYRIKYIGE